MIVMRVQTTPYVRWLPTVQVISDLCGSLRFFAICSAGRPARKRDERASKTQSEE